MSDQSTSEGDKKSKMSKSKKIKIIAIAIVVIVLTGGAIYFALDYKQTKDENKRLSNPQESAKQATQEVVNAVAKLVEIPANETPTLATVSDASKLQGQAFFVNAQNGDKVLIFTQSKKAILYRPSTNKIIEIAPINIGNNNTQTEQQSQE